MTGRVRAHALELLLTPDDDAAVRQIWQVLEQAGLASAARHSGATHRPHVTVISGPAPGREVLALAERTFAPLLPQRVPVAGLVRFGGRRGALAELLVAPPAISAARDRIAERWEGSDTRPWVPHLTLLPRAEDVDAAQALTEVGSPPAERRVVALRWWNPDDQIATVIAG